MVCDTYMAGVRHGLSEQPAATGTMYSGGEAAERHCCELEVVIIQTLFGKLLHCAF